MSERGARFTVQDFALVEQLLSLDQFRPDMVANDECLRLLPREVLIAEVTVGGGALVHGTLEI